jgi:Holliday junction resolvase RusA-like endonuclease
MNKPVITRNQVNWHLTIELPGPPRGKGRPRFVRATGHVYTPDETRRYEQALRDQALIAMGAEPPVNGPLAVYVEALFPIPASWSLRQHDRALAGAILPTGRPDVDNLLKILDALNGVVWFDDKQIVTATIKKRYSNNPTLVVKIFKEALDGRLFDTEDNLCQQDHTATQGQKRPEHTELGRQCGRAA